MVDSDKNRTNINKRLSDNVSAIHHNFRSLPLRLMSIEQYLGVRGDFIDVYISAIESPETNIIENRSLSKIKSDAVKSGRRAKEQDPHETINQSLWIINKLFTGMTILALLAVLITSILGVAVTSAIEFFDLITSTQSLIIQWGPSGLVALSILYIYLFPLDTYVFRQIVDEMRYNNADITRAKSDEQVAAYRIWNHSLTKYRTIPVLTVALLFKWISPKRYEALKKKVIDNIGLMMRNADESYWNLVGTLYAKEKDKND